MRYAYSAKNRQGGTVKGVVEGSDTKNAVKSLQDRQLTPISLSKAQSDFNLGSWLSKYSSASTTEIANFTRQMSTMITAGLPITDALNLLKIQSPPQLAEAIGAILTDVQAGVSLSEAMSKQPRLFSRVYVALVRSGEAAGVLEKVLNRLADSLEKSRDFESKIKAAMIYPAIVLLGMVAVMIIMMVVVVPKLSSLYADFDQTLPLATLIVVGMSSLIINFWWLLIAIGMGVFIGLRAYVKTPAGRTQKDKFLFSVPILGPLLTQTMLTQITRTLALLTGSGVSIIDALNITSSGAGNVVAEAELRKIAHQVEKGFSVSISFSESEVFPLMVGQMMAVGEETGKIDEVLARLSGYYETESEQKVKVLTTAIEPLIIVVLGLGVGFLIFAVIMPIYDITNKF